MKGITFVFTSFIGLLIGCDSGSIFDVAGIGGVQLRIFNNSDYDFINVKVNGIEFDEVKKNTFSRYHEFETAYHYGAVELQIDDKKFGIYPIDYVGETPLKNGQYTYLISVDYESSQLTLTFFKGDNLPGEKQPANLDRIQSIEHQYQATSGKETSDGNIILAGHKITRKVINPTISNVPDTKVLYLPEVRIHTYDEEPLLLKTDNQGNKLWTKFIDENINFYEKKLVEESGDGGFVIAGSGAVLNQKEDGSDFWDMNAYLIKTDAEGNRQWLEMYGEFEFTQAHSIRQTPDRGFIISGHQESSTWLLKVDVNGIEEWSRKLNSEYHGEYVQPTSDNGYIVAGGRFGDIYASPRSGVTKTDALGNELWSNKTRGKIWSAYETSDQSYIVAGSFDYRSTMLIKMRYQGETEWTKYFDDSGGYSIIQIADGGYIVAGITSGNNSLMKTDIAGNVIWHKTFSPVPENFHNLGNSVQESLDGNILLISSTMNDILLIKTDSNGNKIFENRIGE